VIRTIGAAIGVLIIVIVMSDIATHLGAASRAASATTTVTVRR
jgi:hypothetical protein